MALDEKIQEITRARASLRTSFYFTCGMVGTQAIFMLNNIVEGDYGSAVVNTIVAGILYYAGYPLRLKIARELYGPQIDKPTPSEVLGIGANASPQEAKKAYYRLAKEYHPDVNKSLEAKVKFQEITAAYQQMV